MNSRSRMNRLDPTTRWFFVGYTLVALAVLAAFAYRVAQTSALLP